MLVDESFNFFSSRPDVFQVYRLTVGILPQRLGGQIHIDAAGNGEGNHQHRRCQKIGPHALMDTSFKIAVAR